MTGPEAHRLYQDALEAGRLLRTWERFGYYDHEDRDEIAENLRQARAAMEFASFNHKRTR